MVSLTTKTQRYKVNRAKHELCWALVLSVFVLEPIDPASISGLIDSQRTYGSMKKYAEELVKEMMVAGFNNHLEIRLNRAGFKFYVWLNPDLSISGYIHGDQRWDHPGAYRAISFILKSYGLLPEDRDWQNLP